MDAIKLVYQDSLKAEVPQFNIGDTVRVDVNIREGERERIQQFEGTVIARKGSGVSETFTVRRVSYGVGVERLSEWCAWAACAGLSCTTSATGWARLPRSRNSSSKINILLR